MFDGPPSSFLDANETGKSTKCPWVGVVEGKAGGKNRETVTASLCLVFKGRGRSLSPSLIKSINNLLPWRKILSNQENIISIRCSSEFRKIFKGTLLTKSIKCHSY